MYFHEKFESPSTLFTEISWRKAVNVFYVTVLSCSFAFLAVPFIT